MKMIGEILVEKGYVTQQQIEGVLAVNGPDAQVGQVLIQWGLLTEAQLMEALEIQTHLLLHLLRHQFNNQFNLYNLDIHNNLLFHNL